MRALSLPLLLAAVALGASGSQGPFLRESFSGPAVAWTLPQLPGSRAEVAGGVLRLDLAGPLRDLVAYAPGTFTDTRTEVTVARQGSSRAMAGLICRAPDRETLQGYAFLLRGDGAYGLFRFGAQDFHLLTRGQLERPSAGPVRLALECVGDRLAAFVEGRKVAVAELRDRPLPSGGWLGAVALTQEDQQAFSARFDDVLVTPARAVSGPPLPVSVPRSGEVLLREDFSDPASGWYVDERPRYRYVDGQFRVNLQGLRAAWSVTNELLHPEPADVRAEVTLTLAQGPAGGAGGLTCRQVFKPEGSSSFYAFTVTADGAARITPFTDNRPGSPVAQVPAGTVAVQVGRPLRLRVECVGDRLALMAGDRKVLEVRDRRLTAPGRVGVIAIQPEPLEEGATVALFDDLILIQP